MRKRDEQEGGKDYKALCDVIVRSETIAVPEWEKKKLAGGARKLERIACPEYSNLRSPLSYLSKDLLMVQAMLSKT